MITLKKSYSIVQAKSTSRNVIKIVLDILIPILMLTVSISSSRKGGGKDPRTQRPITPGVIDTIPTSRDAGPFWA